ncbi:MAG: RimK family alpha-L-glutamate ligase [Cyanobacteriota bacterium]|jgi:gamma-F420-2:alpha-L-glutamate ligase|nr:RimK family alpha-L-glutamate ligase [Cyanobacteriota bacterium]
MKLWILQKPVGVEGTPAYEDARLHEEARVLGIELETVAPDTIDLIVTRGGRRSVRRCGQEVDLPDGLLPRTGSRTDYFSLAILRQFEHLGVPVINASGAIEAVKDKLFCQQLLAHANLPIPRTMLVRFPVDTDLVERQIGFPCVVKVLVGSYGEGIYLSRDRESFRDLMELVASLNRSQCLILQEYVDDRPGHDLRVWVIGGRVMGAMLRRSVDGSFKANITRGGEGEAFPLDPMIEVLARECAATVGLEIAGVDLLFDGDQYRVCEVNSAPGFSGFESITGTNIARAILQHCSWRIRRQLEAPLAADLPAPRTVDEMTVGEESGRLPAP